MWGGREREEEEEVEEEVEGRIRRKQLDSYMYQKIKHVSIHTTYVHNTYVSLTSGRCIHDTYTINSG